MQMTEALMTTDALVQLNITISRKLDVATPGSAEARQLLRQRRYVRDALEARKAAANN